MWSSDEVSFIEKINSGEKLSKTEALALYYGNRSFLAHLAHLVKIKLHQRQVKFIRNFHIEPTNKCIHACRFCSFSARSTGKGWEYSIPEMRALIKRNKSNAKLVHITGGVHPEYDFGYYRSIIEMIKDEAPHLEIKAFSAVEIWDMAQREGCSVETILRQLQQSGLTSLPGGGAEIFNPSVRKKICPDKISGEEWLAVHRVAHSLGIKSNATMLYGHIETVEDRIDHMMQLRELQSETGGFNAFIPLKFKRANNEMNTVKEVSLLEDISLFSLARVLLPNIPDIKAYWPMLGRETAQLLLSFGVNDLDGTINDSTQIYSRAGATEQNPSLSTQDLIALIREAGMEPVEM